MSMHQHADNGLQGGPGAHGDGPPRSGFWTSRTALVAVAFLAIAAFFLLSEHRAHALGYLPFLLLLACPLLHLFHGGHGGHAGHSGRAGPSKPPTEGADR